MEHAETRKKLEGVSAAFLGARVFVANNGLAAVKFIVSMNDFSFRVFGKRVFRYFGLCRPADRMGESKYLELLDAYIERDANALDRSFGCPRVLVESAVHFNCAYLWPGWGHSSENPELPELCLEKGVCFLGPSADAMRLLGDKVAANILAETNGVRVIPWVEVEILGSSESARRNTPENPSEHPDLPSSIRVVSGSAGGWRSIVGDLPNAAPPTGLPLEPGIMAKSAGSGGGRGIRVVHCAGQIEDAVRDVQAETGVSKVFLTKRLENVRHIEVQVIADTAGCTLALSTRDCTLQRRSQKLVEEGPCSLPGSLAEEACNGACALVSVAKYVGVCTVEFLLCLSENRLYFLEVNPRLQVEHTVSELLTRSNLCATQWLIASGAHIRKLQLHGMGLCKKAYCNNKTITTASTVGSSSSASMSSRNGSNKGGDSWEEDHKGHGDACFIVGARVVAEDPFGFAPSTGKLKVSAVFPAGTSGYFSLDSGAILPCADAQFGHVFGMGGSRTEAISSLRMVLASVRVSGEVKTLNRFLSDILETPEFLQARHNTAYAEKYARKWTEGLASTPFLVVLFVSIYACRNRIRSCAQLKFRSGNTAYTASVTQVCNGVYAVEIGRARSLLRLKEVSDEKYRTRKSTGEWVLVYTFHSKSASRDSYELLITGNTAVFDLGAASSEILAPVSGRIVRYLALHEVKEGLEYVEVESMKHILRLKSPRTGRFSVRAQPGSCISQGDVLVEMLEDNTEIQPGPEIEYTNTSEDYTLNLFRGYDVPEWAWKYTLDSAVSAVRLFGNEGGAGSAPKEKTQSPSMRPGAFLFMKYAARALLEQCPCLPDLEDDIVRARYAARRKRDAQLLSDLDELLSAAKKQRSLKEFDDCTAHSSARSKTSTLQNVQTDVLLRLALEGSERKEAVGEWIWRIFAKRCTWDTRGRALFEISGTACSVEVESPRALPRSGDRKASLVFLICRSGNLNVPECNSILVTTMEVGKEAVEYRTWAGGAEQKKYRGIDPLLAERLGMEQVGANACLLRTAWNRRIFVYTTPSDAADVNVNAVAEQSVAEKSGSSMGPLDIRCIVGEADFFSSPSPGPSDLFEELLVAHALLRMLYPACSRVCVSIRICGALSMAQDQLLRYVHSRLPARILDLIRSEGLQNLEISGALATDTLENPCLAGTILSPAPGSVPFRARARFTRGYAESAVFLGGTEVFYAVDGVRMLKARSTHKAPDVPECTLAESIIQETYSDPGRRKEAEVLHRKRSAAVKLGTLHIGDLAGLFLILLREDYPDARTKEVLLCTLVSPDGRDTSYTLRYGTASDRRSETGMRCWKYEVQMNADGDSETRSFFLLGNDITENNGSFSILGNTFFSLCLDEAMRGSVPLIYVSSNSGAKIEVCDPLKHHIAYDREARNLYLTEDAYRTLPSRDWVCVREENTEKGKKYVITGILGDFGMGVENLASSAHIAQRMAAAYEAIPTLTYVTGRAVGIGAYLARLGQRIIQKSSSPIILTGSEALNRLVQQKVYANNLQIGGPQILAANGVVHLNVRTDSDGAREVIRWLGYVFSRDRKKSAKSVTAFKIPRENLNPEELVEVLADRHTFTEYLRDWAPNVRVGRMRISGMSCGVIFPNPRSSVSPLPSSSLEPDGQKVWTEHLLLPETSKKIARCVRDFTKEGLKILILVNWKGFSAGHMDMFEGILQGGAEIIESIRAATTKIYTYLGPGAELRGGSWVVFDKVISSQVFFAAHSTAKGSVIHPDALADMKFKGPEREKVLARSPVSESEKSVNNGSDEKESLELGKAFCDLHDTSARMLKMQVIDAIVPLSDLASSIIAHWTDGRT